MVKYKKIIIFKNIFFSVLKNYYLILLFILQSNRINNYFYKLKKINKI